MATDCIGQTGYQASMLESIKIPAKNLRNWAGEVKSGDSDNHEAKAAVILLEEHFP